MIRKAVTLLVLMSLVAFTACASSSKEGTSPVQASNVGQANSMKSLSLRIASPVKAGTPYPALMTCTLPAAGVENVGGYFFWNEEGPFEYQVAQFDIIKDPAKGQRVVLKFMLYTGRPSTYTISGFVSYRDKATGLMGNTERVSAGAVTVR